MAKKGHKKTTPKQRGQALTVRCSDEDAELFEKAANIEGFATIQQWMLVLARKRARAIESAAQAGDAMEIRETVIMPKERS